MTEEREHPAMQKVPVLFDLGMLVRSIHLDRCLQSIIFVSLSELIVLLRTYPSAA